MAEDVERSEKPTPKRREEARRKGQIAVSQEVFVVANLLAVTVALLASGHSFLVTALASVPRIWAPRETLDVTQGVELLRSAFRPGIQAVFPILLAAAGAALAVGLAQTRGQLSPTRAKLDFQKLSPARNLSRLIKVSGPIELPKSLLKLAAVGIAVYFAIGDEAKEFRGLPRLDLLSILRFQLRVVLEAFLAGAAVMMLIAAADYAYVFYKTEKSMRMSRSEVKDEHRQSEGDPQMRARRLSLQFERSRQRMMQAVPQADVIVTNPEHISVALQYRRGEMHAPKVVAKGAGFLALRIREIAREHGVPIVENKPIARTLYRTVKVGQEIPEKLFQAVAEVLAYVYRLDRKRGMSW
jgi:flagellar biosynthetic protein FlhB